MGEFSVFCKVRSDLLRPILNLLDPAKHLRICFQWIRQVPRALEFREAHARFKNRDPLLWPNNSEVPNNNYVQKTNIFKNRTHFSEKSTFSGIVHTSRRSRQSSLVRQNTPESSRRTPRNHQNTPPDKGPLSTRPQIGPPLRGPRSMPPR